MSARGGKQKSFNNKHAGSNYNNSNNKQQVSVLTATGSSQAMQNKEHAQEQKKMNKSGHLIKSYDIARFMSLTYTGGRVVKSQSEKFFVCCADKSANVIDSQTGSILSELAGVRTKAFEHGVH